MLLTFIMAILLWFFAQTGGYALLLWMGLSAVGAQAAVSGLTALMIALFITAAELKR